MQRFLQERNVVLYRRLRNSSTGETERRMIIKLLVEQMDKLKMSKKSTPARQVRETVQQRVRAMMAYVASEGRLFALKPSEWGILLVGVALCGFATLLF